MSEPADPTTPAAPVPSAPSEEEEAWTQVLASWNDEQVHRAYQARFTDLEAIAVAGGRYRAVLAEKPQDAMALQMRDELLKKATVIGLSTLPRTVRRETPVAVKRLIMLAALTVGSAAVWIVYRIIVLLGAGS
jgi:hypothetical protein